MADADHAPAFWTSVATTFESDPAVMFDLFNEPYIGNSNASTSTSPWSCWLNGCNTTYTDTINGVTNSSVTYATAGMQQLVNTVRATGATQPLILGGLDYASDPCGVNDKYESTAACPELTNMPTDPLNQLAVDFHVYGSASDSATSLDASWNDELEPLSAAQVPLVTDELGEADCQDGFMNDYMDWADQNDESYLAWAWVPYSSSYTASPVCSVGSNNNWELISDWDGTPNSLIPQGTNYQAHLAAVSPY
jgi:hypothetical protein